MVSSQSPIAFSGLLIGFQCQASHVHLGWKEKCVWDVSLMCREDDEVSAREQLRTLRLHDPRAEDERYRS